MSTFQLKTWAALSTLTVGLLSGCGGEAYRPVATAGTGTGGTVTGGTGGTGNTGTANVPPTNWGGGTGTGTGTTGTTGSTSANVSTAPAFSYQFTVTGEGGTAPTFDSPSVETDNKLWIRIFAMSAGQISSTTYSNFSGTYGCVQYTIRALGKTLTTPILSTGAGSSNCPGAPTFADLDFSDRLGAGHNTVNVSVTQVHYDFYCNWAKWVNASPYNIAAYGIQNEMNYCPVRTVYRTHTVNGRMQIAVNGTDFTLY